MLNRQTLRLLAVLLALCFVLTTANTVDAVNMDLKCWKTLCAPPGVSTYIDQNGCLVTTTCAGVHICILTVCPPGAGGGDDSSGNN